MKFDLLTSILSTIKAYKMVRLMNGFQSDAEESFRALLAKYGFVCVRKKYQEERHLKLPHTTSSSSLTSGMESSLSSEEFKNL